MDKDNVRRRAPPGRRRVLFLGALVVALVGTVLVFSALYVWGLRSDRACRLALAYEEAKSRGDLGKLRTISNTIDSLGEDGLAVLEMMYKSTHPNPHTRSFIRVQATQRLHRIPSQRATSILIERLKDEDEYVRSAAMTTLGYRADTIALDAVMAAYKKARSIGEMGAGAISLGTLYRHSDPKPRHVFDLFVATVRADSSIDAKYAALDGLECCMAPGQATDAEKAALPVILDVFEKIPKLAPGAYGVIYVLTGRDFAGLHTPTHEEWDASMISPVPASESEFVAALGLIDSLAEDGELRSRVVSEVRAWMREKGIR